MAQGIMDKTNRIEALEFKVAHLERALQELSDVLYRQQRELDGMLELNRQLRNQVEQLETRGADANSVESPPHY
jgi:SlyX protein